jgi:hypothetical protein
MLWAAARLLPALPARPADKRSAAQHSLLEQYERRWVDKWLRKQLRKDEPLSRSLHPIPLSDDPLDQQVDTDRPVRVLAYDPMELKDGKA